MFKKLDSKSEIDPSSTEGIQVGPDFKGDIEFNEVWFRYPSRKDQWILKGFSASIKSKESVAFVGESGSGKSTLVQLLFRFYEPQFGSIKLDGIDIQEYNLKSL